MANPAVGLVLATDGNLYGTASTGGATGTNAGTAFKIATSGTLTTLYNFCQDQPYCNDGLAPQQMIQGRDGNFYGMTAQAVAVGNIFQLTPSGRETSLYTFCSILSCKDGRNPASIMQAGDGNFYGVDNYGGGSHLGGLWQLLADGSTFNLLYAFDGAIGAGPSVALVQGRDGQLYGVAPAGGIASPDCPSNCGTVFKITLSGNPTLLYDFCSQTNCTDGAIPTSALVQGSDGDFYGTTSLGGTNGAGEIFRITPSGTLTVLHNFVGAEGGGVVAPMIQGRDGNFYGTASTGGAYGGGSIFQITPGGSFATIYSFQGPGGVSPQGGLVQDSQGSFYGTTYQGGANNYGTVFRFQPISYTLTVSTTGNGSVTSTDGYINCPGTCSHSYIDNAQVTLNALPAAGWNLSNWGGACSGNGASCTVIMSQAQTVSATFVQSTYTLTVSTSGNGSVTSTDGFINCPGTCSHSYLSFTPVTLNAVAQSGWVFAGWTGACSGVGACNLTMTGNLGVTAVFIEPGHGLEFSPTTPCRLVDTRQTGGAIQGGSSRDFPVQQEGGCNIPATAAAYSLNVTVVPQGQLGYLTIWPTGEYRPVVSTLNSPDGRVKANAAIVPAGTSGEVSVYVTNTTNVVLDIDGYFAPVTGSTLAFYPLAPCRVADTRKSSFPTGLGPPSLSASVERKFPILNATSCNIPSSAAAYSLNFTVVPSGTLGYLTVWPTGQTRPTVSTLNDVLGRVIANAAIVVAGTGSEVSAYATNNTDLIIDINGYFAPAGTGGLSLYPAAPCRVLDTRHVGSGQPFTGTLNPPVDVVHSQCGVSSLAQAYVFNATVIPVQSLGYLTLWPDGESQSVVSTLNAQDGSLTNNMAVVPAGTAGKVDAFANGLTQLLLDISSYFAP